jgi:hypothetical protein
MIGVKVGATSGPMRRRGPVPPVDLGWTAPALVLQPVAAGWRPGLEPRSLVSPAIWSGAAIHVDAVLGNDSNSGLGSPDGTFTQAKKSIHAAITAGNATGAAYRIIVRTGQFAGSAFTSNGTVEPNRPCAIIGWDGPVRYRAGNWSQAWALDQGTTYTATVTSVMRVFRTDVATPEGLYTELTQAADLASCRATVGTWFKAAGDVLHVNIGKAPSTTDIAPIRAFHGARFLTHSADLYLENIHCEGGITGALHCDAISTRTIVGVNCSFRYSSPSTSGPNPLDAVQIRRVNGLVAFFDSDASFGAKDGWNFHEDGNPQMRVLMVNCTAFRNGALGATSCNAFTTHDGVISAVIGGQFGLSRNGTEVHHIETARSWMLGSLAVARDIDGSSTAFKCSNTARLWLEGTAADAAGSVENWAIEANGGQVLVRDHVDIAGGRLVSGGGSITPF